MTLTPPGFACRLGPGELVALAVSYPLDRARAAYLKHFYAIDRELPIHYDLVLNTDRLAPTSAAALISKAARP